jgi:hypothetical protein
MEVLPENCGKKGKADEEYDFLAQYTGKKESFFYEYLMAKPPSK